MRILVTGAAGFIGSNYVNQVLNAHRDYELVVLDKLTYAGNLMNLEAALASPRVTFVRMDICDAEIADVIKGCDAVVHFAAESHVDRSIEDASAFVRTNVEGTWRLLDASKRSGISRFVHVSTDEVYGSLGPEGKFLETTPIDPNSPYAATKAASDLLVQSYVRTFHFPAVITRCSNNYGPYQFPEKFIPLMISQAMAGDYLPVYGDGKNIRDWIHVSDHCAAIDLILHKGLDGEVYNIGGDCELENIQVAKRILRECGRPETLLKFVMDRPGHDRRYAMDCTRLKNSLGWTPKFDFEKGLSSTIQWYRCSTEWLEKTRSGQYREYFGRHYENREKTFASGAV